MAVTEEMTIPEEMTIEEALSALIADSDLVEVTTCLDRIAHESGRHILIVSGAVEYPAQPDTER